MLALLLAAALHVSPALADDVDLFSVKKPYHAQNELEVQARTNGCVVQNVDFLWHMDVDAKGNPQSTKPVASAIESRARQQFPISGTSTTNAAACANAVPKGVKCSSLSVKVEQIGWVNSGLKDPSLVVRADMASGSCNVGAYLDVGGKAVQIAKLIIVADNVQISYLPPGASFRLKGVVIQPSSGANITFPCTQDCSKSE